MKAVSRIKHADFINIRCPEKKRKMSLYASSRIPLAHMRERSKVANAALAQVCRIQRSLARETFGSCYSRTASSHGRNE